MQNKTPIFEFDFQTKKDLEDFSKTAIDRSDNLFGAALKPNTYFTTGLAEEVGEVCGIAKKLERGFTNRDFVRIQAKLAASDQPEVDEAAAFDIWLAKQKDNLGSELADVFIYLTILAQKNHINFLDAVELKFNSVTKQMTPTNE